MKRLLQILLIIIALNSCNNEEEVELVEEKPVKPENPVYQIVRDFNDKPKLSDRHFNGMIKLLDSIHVHQSKHSFNTEWPYFGSNSRFYFDLDEYIELYDKIRIRDNWRIAYYINGNLTHYAKLYSYQINDVDMKPALKTLLKIGNRVINDYNYNLTEKEVGDICTFFYNNKQYLQGFEFEKDTTSYYQYLLLSLIGDCIYNQFIEGFIILDKESLNSVLNSEIPFINRSMEYHKSRLNDSSISLEEREKQFHRSVSNFEALYFLNDSLDPTPHIYIDKDSIYIETIGLRYGGLYINLDAFSINYPHGFENKKTTMLLKLYPNLYDFNQVATPDYIDFQLE